MRFHVVFVSITLLDQLQRLFAAIQHILPVAEHKIYVRYMLAKCAKD